MMAMSFVTLIDWRTVHTYSYLHCQATSCSAGMAPTAMASQRRSNKLPSLHCSLPCLPALPALPGGGCQQLVAWQCHA